MRMAAERIQKFLRAMLRDSVNSGRIAALLRS
jgi:hypothetical protein